MAGDSFDVVVLGGGPGGYVAAIRAAQLGLKTALVEREKPGGICLNWGCIPTKALLRSAEVYHLMQNASAFGLRTGEVSLDLAAIVARSRKASEKLSNGIGFLLKKNNISLIKGEGKLAGPRKLEVSRDGKKKEIESRNIILATGARARTLAGMEPDGERIWSYREAMVPQDLPRRLLVIGSGAIGIEFASFYNTLGTEVSVVEVMERILPVEDEDISSHALKAFRKRGMTMITGGKVEKLEHRQDCVRAHIVSAEKTQVIEVDRVISAVGITGNVEGIGLEALNITVVDGHVKTNAWCETGVESIYAIGDLAGPPWLAHKASHEGVMVSERIAGVKGVHPLDPAKIPGCTYSDPQIASVGLGEEQAKKAGHTVRVGRFPFSGNGKAVAMGDTDGMVKTVFDAETGELLGAHMIGPEVTELIQGYAIARQLESTEADIMATVFPHPTLSEMMHESVLNAYGRALHI